MDPDFESGSGSSISSESGSNTDPGFWWLKTGEKKRTFFYILFWSKIAIYLSLGLHKAVQATGEALSPQKRTYRTSKMKFINFFCFCGSFLPSWIRIYSTAKDDEEQWKKIFELINFEKSPGPLKINFLFGRVRVKALANLEILSGNLQNKVWYGSMRNTDESRP